MSNAKHRAQAGNTGFVAPPEWERSLVCFLPPASLGQLTGDRAGGGSRPEYCPLPVRLCAEEALAGLWQGRVEQVHSSLGWDLKHQNQSSVNQPGLQPGYRM